MGLETSYPELIKFLFFKEQTKSEVFYLFPLRKSFIALKKLEKYCF